MDLSIILALVSGAVIIILLFFVLLKDRSGNKETEEKRGRVPAPRNARARQRAAAAQQQNRVVDDGDAVDQDANPVHMGTKKRAKLEAKAEKKALREQEERDREEKKRRKEQLDEERKSKEEKLELEEKLKEDALKKEEEEREKKEHEEYLQMKTAFSVEEEGFDEHENVKDANLLENFITYIQDMKVVSFEDLAAKFQMKTQFAIARVQDLQSEGHLTGVIDDRGKFIYISQKELEAVAKFVKQRGRVSLSELVENSHSLVNLVPNITVET